jgi:hypothetical protein
MKQVMQCWLIHLCLVKASRVADKALWLCFNFGAAVAELGVLYHSLTAVMLVAGCASCQRGHFISA